MIPQTCRCLIVIAALLSSLESQGGSQGDSLLCLAHPEGFTSSPEAAERLLNLQASRGYRLVSLGALQVWRGVPSGSVPEYRIAIEGQNRALRQPKSAAVDANALFQDRVNALAREGFRVHPDAHSPFRLHDWWGAARGAVVMERVADSPHACTYEVVTVERDEIITVPRGFVPVALHLRRGVLTESCGAADSIPADGLTVRWLELLRLDSSSRIASRAEKSLASRAGKRCSFFDGNAELRGWSGIEPGMLILCGAPASVTSHEYRVLTPHGATTVGAPAPATLSASQAELNTAGADGYCLVGSLWEGQGLVFEKLTPRTERCEYRLVVAQGASLVAIVNRALAEGFRPVSAARFNWGVVLERRRPAE